VYLGVIIAIAGCVVALFGTITRENSTIVAREESQSNVWSFSAHYDKGQKLGFGLSTGDYWLAYETSDEFVVGGDFIDYLPVIVTITAPTPAPGKNVTFEVEYTPNPASTAPIPALDILIVKVLHKSDILKMETSIEDWTTLDGKNTFTSEYLEDSSTHSGVGIVQHSGWYYVTINPVGLSSPPRKIVLYKHNVEIAQDYWYLIPVGAAIAAIGVVVAVFGARSVQKRARVEMLKKT